MGLTLYMRLCTPDSPPTHLRLSRELRRELDRELLRELRREIQCNDFRQELELPPSTEHTS